jgi:class 3 adenylate cyclase
MFHAVYTLLACVLPLARRTHFQLRLQGTSGMLVKAASFGGEVKPTSARGERSSAARQPFSFMAMKKRGISVAPDTLVADLPSPDASSPTPEGSSIRFFGQYSSKPAVSGGADAPTPRHGVPGLTQQSEIFSPVATLGRSNQPPIDGVLPRKKAGKVEDFIPEHVIRYVQRNIGTDSDQLVTAPSFDQFTAVVMFADLSGFTVMSESLATKGGLGAENLGFWLNRYFEQLVKLVAKAGGDVFKFAGDALIALWGPEGSGSGSCASVATSDASSGSMPTAARRGSATSATQENGIAKSAPAVGKADSERMMRRAIQCALQIQSELHDAQFARGVKFNIKIGIGFGTVNILYVGGMLGRLEYVTTGEALMHALNCEHECRWVMFSALAPPSLWSFPHCFPPITAPNTFMSLHDLY